MQITQISHQNAAEKLHYPQLPCPAGFATVSRKDNWEQHLVWDANGCFFVEGTPDDFEVPLWWSQDDPVSYITWIVRQETRRMQEVV